MNKRRKALFFYFYGKEELTIKEKVKKRTQSGIFLILKKISVAAITTVFLYELVVYLNVGSLKLPPKEALLEIPLVFLFLLFMFLMHERISKIVASKKFRDINSPKREIVEVLIVIVATFILTLLINFLPLYFLLGSDAFVPLRVRTAFTISIVISLFFYYLVERERMKKELQQEMLNATRLQKENFEAQLQSLRSQVNPHFLFNSLNVLGSLIQQDKKRALKFKDRLADLYRALLDHGEHQLISLKQELEVAHAYIYLLKTRFGNSIKFEEDIPESSLEMQIPPGSLQMLLENAIKHNGSTRKKPLLIQIYITKELLIVRNNLQPRLEKIESTRTGLKNITSRYSYLTNKEVEIEKAEKEFVIKLPLLAPHESSNY